MSSKATDATQTGTFLQQSIKHDYHASNASNCARYSYYLIIFLAAFIPFEDFILKFLPVPDTIYFASRFISELLIYGLFTWMVLHKALLRAPFVHTPIDIPVLIFACVCLMSLVSNVESLKDIFVGILNLRPVFRYVILFYLIVNTPLSSRQVKNVIRVLIISGILMMLSGLSQAATGGALNSILAPRDSGVEIGGDQRHSNILEGGREIGAVHGAATDTNFFAYTMNVLFLICIAKIRFLVFSSIPKKSIGRSNADSRALGLAGLFFCLLPFIVLADLLAFVRISVIAFLLILFLECFFWLGRKTTLSLAGGCVFLLALVVVVFPPSWKGGGATQTTSSPIEDLTAVLTVAYLKNSVENQRLHQLITIPPTVLLNRPLVGYGPVEETVVDDLNDAEPSFLYRDIYQPEFQDVYWVAILAKYGLAGFLSFAAIFYALFRSASMLHVESSLPVQKEIALMVLYMVLIASLILFFDRVFEFRTFGFYFWVLPGLMFSLSNFDANTRVRQWKNERSTA